MEVLHAAEVFGSSIRLSSAVTRLQAEPQRIVGAAAEASVVLYSCGLRCCYSKAVELISHCTG